MISLPRRVLRRGTAFIVVIGLLAPTACSSGDEPEQTGDQNGPPDQVTYLTAFGEFGREGYAHVADAKGFFADENIDVTIEPGDPGNAQVITEGQADFAATDSSGAFQRFQAGLDGFRIISAVQQQPLLALITKESTGLTAPTDLEGATVGCAENSIIGLLFPAYANNFGLDPASVNLEPVDAPQIPAALASGQVDAVCLFAVGRPAIESATGETAIVFPYDEVLFDLYGAVHIANAELVAENPDLARRFNNAIVRGMEYATANPEEAGEILAEYVPETDPAVAAGELEIMAGYMRAGLDDNNGSTGTMVASKTTRAVTLLQAAGLLDLGSINLIDKIMAWELIPGATEHDLERL